MTCLAQLLAVVALGKSGRAMVADMRAVPILALSLGSRCVEATPRERVDCWPDGAVRLARDKDEIRLASSGGDLLLMDSVGFSLFPGQTPSLILEESDAIPRTGYTVPVPGARDLRCARASQGLSKALSRCAENLFRRQTDPLDLLEAALGSQKQDARLLYAADCGVWLALSPLWCRSFPDRISLMSSMFGDGVPLNSGVVAHFRLPVMQHKGQRFLLRFQNEKPHVMPAITCKDPDARLEIGPMDRSGAIEMTLHATSASYLDLTIEGHRQSLQSIHVHLSFEQQDTSDAMRDPLDHYGDPLDVYQEAEP